MSQFYVQNTKIFEVELIGWEIEVLNNEFSTKIRTDKYKVIKEIILQKPSFTHLELPSEIEVFNTLQEAEKEIINNK